MIVNLPRLAADHRFDVVTVDQSLGYNQDIRDPPIPVVIMIADRIRFQGLQPLVAEVVAVRSGRGLRAIEDRLVLILKREAT